MPTKSHKTGSPSTRADVVEPPLEGGTPTPPLEGDLQPGELPEGYFHPDQVTQAIIQKAVEEEGYPEKKVVGDAPDEKPEAEGREDKEPV